jgi:hypothetical protein
MNLKGKNEIAIFLIFHLQVFQKLRMQIAAS